MLIRFTWSIITVNVIDQVIQLNDNSFFPNFECLASSSSSGPGFTGITVYNSAVTPSDRETFQRKIVISSQHNDDTINISC